MSQIKKVQKYSVADVDLTQIEPKEEEELNLTAKKQAILDTLASNPTSNPIDTITDIPTPDPVSDATPEPASDPIVEPKIENPIASTSKYGKLVIDGTAYDYSPIVSDALEAELQGMDKKVAQKIRAGLNKLKTPGFIGKYDSNSNRFYVTDLNDQKAYDEQESWSQRTGLDVMLGGIFNTYKNKYNEGISKLFGITIPTEEPKKEESLPTLKKTPHSVDAITLALGKDKKPIEFDPMHSGVKARLNALAAAMGDPNWYTTNEFVNDPDDYRSFKKALSDEDILNYIKNNGDGEFWNGLKNRLKEGQLTDSDKKFLNRFNIMLQDGTTPVGGNSGGSNPGNGNSDVIINGIGNDGGRGNGSESKGEFKNKNIFDNANNYLVYNNRYIFAPKDISQFDADLSGMISTEKYPEVYEWVGLDGKKYYYPIKDANELYFTGDAFEGWNPDILGDEKTRQKISDENVYAFGRNLIRTTNMLDQHVKPVGVITDNSGKDYIVYYDDSNNQSYVRVDTGNVDESGNREYTLYEALKNKEGKIIGWNEKKERKGALYKNKNGGILYAKIGNVIEPSSTTNSTPNSTSNSKVGTNVTTVNTITTKKPQRHAGNTNWEKIDKWRAGMVGLGTASALAGFVPIAGDAIGTVGGLVSDAGNFVIDLADKDVTTKQAFKNLGINAGLTVLALLPGMDVLKLSRNTSKAAKAISKTAEATKKAKNSIKTAKDLDAVETALKSVKKAITTSNKELKTIKSTKKVEDTIGSLISNSKVMSIPEDVKDLKMAKKLAFEELSHLESAIAETSQKIGKPLKATEFAKNSAKVALGTTGTLAHVGLTGLGAVTAGAAANDLLQKRADENYEFTPEDWLNINAVLHGAIGAGRRYQRARVNRGMAATNSTEKLPSVSKQMFRTTPYAKLLPQNASNPYNQISNPWKYEAFNNWRVPNKNTSKWNYWFKTNANSPSYYGIPSDFAQRWTYLFPGEETTTSVTYYKDGGVLYAKRGTTLNINDLYKILGYNVNENTGRYERNGEELNYDNLMAALAEAKDYSNKYNSYNWLRNGNDQIKNIYNESYLVEAPFKNYIDNYTAYDKLYRDLLTDAQKWNDENQDDLKGFDFSNYQEMLANLGYDKTSGKNGLTYLKEKIEGENGYLTLAKQLQEAAGNKFNLESLKDYDPKAQDPYTGVDFEMYDTALSNRRASKFHDSVNDYEDLTNGDLWSKMYRKQQLQDNWNAHLEQGRRNHNVLAETLKFADAALTNKRTANTMIEGQNNATKALLSVSPRHVEIPRFVSQYNGMANDIRKNSNETFRLLPKNRDSIGNRNQAFALFGQRNEAENSLRKYLTTEFMNYLNQISQINNTNSQLSYEKAMTNANAFADMHIRNADYASNADLGRNTAFQSYIDKLNLFNNEDLNRDKLADQYEANLAFQNWRANPNGEAGKALYDQAVRLARKVNSPNNNEYNWRLFNSTV